MFYYADVSLPNHVRAGLGTGLKLRCRYTWTLDLLLYLGVLHNKIFSSSWKTWFKPVNWRAFLSFQRNLIFSLPPLTWGPNNSTLHRSTLTQKQNKNCPPAHAAYLEHIGLITYIAHRSMAVGQCNAMQWPSGPWLLDGRPSGWLWI